MVWLDGAVWLWAGIRRQEVMHRDEGAGSSRTASIGRKTASRRSWCLFSIRVQEMSSGIDFKAVGQLHLCSDRWRPGAEGNDPREIRQGFGGQRLGSARKSVALIPPAVESEPSTTSAEWSRRKRRLDNALGNIDKAPRA